MDNVEKEAFKTALAAIPVFFIIWLAFNWVGVLNIALQANGAG